MNSLTTRGNNDQNFIKQLAVYAGVTLFFMALLTGAKLVSWDLWDSQQMIILIDLVLGIGFAVYLRISDHNIDTRTQIGDRAALYWICLWISLIVISNFYRPDIGWSNNIPMNILLIIETLCIAVADETVFRAFGDYCFTSKGPKEEAAMIICYTMFYTYSFADGTAAGLNALVLALGTGTLFTGLYLRYRRLGANILYHFVMIWLMRMTAINSTSDTPVLGRSAAFIFAVGIIGMIWYGMKLIKAFNEEGVYGSDGQEDDSSSELAKAFTESKDKYKEKLITKAEPRVEKNRERYITKRNTRAEKQEAKREAKKAAKQSAGRGKKDD